MTAWRGPLTTAVGIAAALGATACGSSSSPAAEEPAPTTASQTPLEAAADACGAGVVADAGQTLIVDTKGEDDVSGESFDDLACLLVHLDTPTSVTEHMSSTRALDGMQTNDWDQFSARWTYHPDNGMGLTITLAD